MNVQFPDYKNVNNWASFFKRLMPIIGLVISKQWKGFIVIYAIAIIVMLVMKSGPKETMYVRIINKDQINVSPSTIKDYNLMLFDYIQNSAQSYVTSEHGIAIKIEKTDYIVIVNLWTDDTTSLYLGEGNVKARTDSFLKIIPKNYNIIIERKPASHLFINSKYFLISIVAFNLLWILLQCLRILLTNRVNVVAKIKMLPNTTLIGVLGTQYKLNWKTIDAISGFWEELSRIYFRLQSNDKNDRVILVSSPFAGEGAPTVVAVLGHRISTFNKKVLLIDCDLRKSKLTDIILGDTNKEFVNVNKGISDFLKESNNIKEYIKETSVENLYILPSGYISNNALHLLSLDTLQTLIYDLNESFDYLIINSPPALVVADASIIAKWANILITVVRMEYGTYEQAEICVESLREFNKNAKSFVLLNKADNQINYGFRYGYGYVERTIKD